MMSRRTRPQSQSRVLLCGYRASTLGLCRYPSSICNIMNPPATNGRLLNLIKCLSLVLVIICNLFVVAQARMSLDLIVDCSRLLRFGFPVRELVGWHFHVFHSPTIQPESIWSNYGNKGFYNICSPHHFFQPTLKEPTTSLLLC
jgi:hypothetical protein